MDSASTPLAYLLTWTTYGIWLHGDVRGSVDEVNRFPGELFIPPNSRRKEFESKLLQAPARNLNDESRSVVQKTILEVSQHRGWKALAIHVRPQHLHAVIHGTATPEKMFVDLKAYCTRRLRESGLLNADEKVWTKHASTRYLWTEESVRQAMHYVVNEQGTAIEPPPFQCELV